MTLVCWTQPQQLSITNSVLTLKRVHTEQKPLVRFLSHRLTNESRGKGKLTFISSFYNGISSGIDMVKYWYWDGHHTTFYCLQIWLYGYLYPCHTAFQDPSVQIRSSAV